MKKKPRPTISGEVLPLYSPMIEGGFSILEVRLRSGWVFTRRSSQMSENNQPQLWSLSAKVNVTAAQSLHAVDEVATAHSENAAEIRRQSSETSAIKQGLSSVE
jgi:hypothetical protein